MKFEKSIRFLSGAILLLYAVNSVVAAPNPEKALEIALNYLNENQAFLGLSQPDLSNQVVKDQYVTQHNGVTHIYLRQQHNGIELFGGDIAIHIAKDGSVIKVNNQFVPNLNQAVNTTKPFISAVQAVQSTAQHLGLTLTTDLVIQENIAGTSVILTGGGISLDDIPAKLVYQKVSQGEVRLAWEVRVRQSDHWWNLRIDAVSGKVLSKNDWIVNDNDYKVFPLPSISPEDPGFSPTLVNAPANAIASPFGWHDTDGVAGAEFTDTRGNNVSAQEDTDADNNAGLRPDGGANLIFDFAWDPALQPWEAPNQEAAIVNLFYWNNVIHDVFYQYGFDEASGNFQENNYGNGGSGADSVQADAQDGSGINNANFATPPDGQKPRMQMFLWDKTSPQRDGDLENTIIIHEYGHGISNRLVGGPSNVNCLGNAEQMGEGWSDWLALVMTALESEHGASARGIGPYVLGQPPEGQGIRPARYTTDMTENAYTYGDIGNLSIPHGVGFVWATMLWEMEWKLIEQYGFDDVYTGNGGNNLAIQLVIDGMKFTNCNPGFVDARNAILLADQTNNGGANQCLIWEAFAKRGLGFSADQGSTSSSTDGTEAFDLPPECLEILKISKTANPSPVEAGALLDYTLEVHNYTPDTLTDVTITDNVPANTSYVSATCGGSESGGIVTFPLGTMNSKDTATCTFQVRVSGNLSHTDLFVDDMESGSGNWTVSHGQGQKNWALNNSNPYSGSSAWFAQDTDVVTDQYLSMSNQLALSGRPILHFWHQYNTESSFDGGVVEISTDGGTTWTDVTMTQNGYNGIISSSWGSPIGGRQAFTGNSGGYIETRADLSSYNGQNVQIRFRFATDTSRGGNGWYVDDVQIVDEAAIFNEACVEASSGALDCASVLTPVIPAPSAVVVSTDIIIDFGADGIWAWLNNESWQSLHSVSPDSMVTGDLDDNNQDDVIIDFGEQYGIWLWMNNSSWAQLHTLSPESMVTGDIDGSGQDDVIIDFGEPYGIWVRMNNNAWKSLHNISPESMVTGDIDGSGQDDVIIDFGSQYGIWVWMNNNAWESLHNISPESMVTGDIDGSTQDDVIIDFGSQYGIWVRMNNTNWVKLHNLSPEGMVTGDIDGSTQDDVIIDFGEPYGIWVRMNNNTWALLHNLSPEGMVTGDIDGSGQDDVIVDFGSQYGIWRWMNNNTWALLHSLSPESMVTGNIDGLGSTASSNNLELSDTLLNVETIELPEPELGIQLP